MLTSARSTDLEGGSAKERGSSFPRRAPTPPSWRHWVSSLCSAGSATGGRAFHVLMCLDPSDWRHSGLFEDEGEEDTAPVKTEATDEEPSDEEDEPVPAPALQPAQPASATENVAKLLRQLQSSGALVRRPAAPVSPAKVDHRCVTCCLRFPDWSRLERHLIEHVSLPWVALERLPDDDDTPPSSDDEGGSPAPPASTPAQDIARRLSNSGISIKKPSPANVTTDATANAALDKLSGLGFTIKKTTPVKEEKPDLSVAANSTPDILQKLGKLGGIKLKLKSEGNDTNSFKVVNGLKDFKTSDDEDSERDDEPRPSDDDEEADAEERPPVADATRLPVPALVRANVSAPPRPSSLKVEPIKIAPGIQAAIRPARPVIKQTPKRVPGSESIRPPAPVSAQSFSAVSASATEGSRPKGLSPPTQSKEITTSSSPNRATTATRLMDNVVVKKEVDDDVKSGNVPLFAGQIKTERASPPVEEPAQVADPTPASAPTDVTVKTEADTAGYGDASEPLFSNDRTSTHSAAFASAPTPPLRQTPSQPLPPVTKTEDSGVTIIEINGDSNDEDDDCCVVSATPAPDVKPLLPKIETPAYSSSATSAYTSSPVATGNILATQLSGGGDARSDYYWNASESKPPIDALQKSADELFESLLASTTKKENLSLADASEYISLDRLGSQHSCDVCNTRFTDVTLLDEHIRITGHCKSIVTPGSVSSAVLPYGANSNAIMSSLLPVKQLAEQVGKLSGSGGFTHQQNVMINIQAYPGAGGMMVPPQTYNPYGAGQPMGPGGPYQNPATGMYQPYPGQQPYGQPYQTPMSKAGFNATAPGMYATAPGTHAPPYSTASSGLQQSAYGQPAGHMNPPQSPLGMGPHNAAPGQVSSPQYPPHSSPGLMKPPTSSSGIRIQNVQTFAPGQGPIVSAAGQVNTPTPVRMAGPTLGPVRPRVSAPRARPIVRPGAHMQGQMIRGGKATGPRMPLKRTLPTGGAVGPGGGTVKRRSDMLLPGRHDNEDCHVTAMQKQRDGMPLIHSVQGAKDGIKLGSNLTITKKTVNREANAMADVLASRGIMVKAKQKSRSPSPERPLPHIPNLGAGVSIKHGSRSSSFTIPEARVGGGGMYTCKVCRKGFMSSSALAAHASAAHGAAKVPLFRCDECPASYPKSLQLQHHKRVFHNVTGPDRELGLPVVDLSQEDNVKRLSSLGIYSFIPLANREQASGCFGIPVVSVRGGAVAGLSALGADGLLSLGPLKPLPNS